MLLLLSMYKPGGTGKFDTGSNAGNARTAISPYQLQGQAALGSCGLLSNRNKKCKADENV